MVRNIYDGKSYRYFIIVPLAVFMICVVLLIPRIQLDSSLKGGVSIQLITNATINAKNLTYFIDARIAGAQSSVSRSPGGVSITIADNSTLSAAQSTLIKLYALNGNYSAAELNITTLRAALANNPDNATALAAAISRQQAAAAASLGSTKALTGQLFGSLAPFIGNATPAYNASNEQSMVNAAQSGVTLAQGSYKAKVIAVLHSAVPFTSYSFNYVTPTLGAYFLRQMRTVLIVSFILVAIAALVIFRNPIPSFAVVFGAVSDIVVALGAMGAFGIPLGVASIGGLLMLVGYSMDTDMLSAIRILKRHEGTASERAFSSMKTGLTMTIAAIISFLILLVISYITFIPTYFEISTIVIFGLCADILTTWFINVPITLWYKHRRERHAHS